MTSGSRICSKCGETRTPEEFWKGKICRPCRRAWENAYKKRRRAEDPDYRERLNAACRSWYDDRKDDPEFRLAERERLNDLRARSAQNQDWVTKRRESERKRMADPDRRARRRETEHRRLSAPGKWEIELARDNATRRRRYSEDPVYRESVIARIRARKAKERGASGGESIRLDALMERDGGVCHLCDKKVARNQASVDHLVPLSAGGAHLWVNVALAHRTCNARRQHRGPAQLRLLG